MLFCPVVLDSETVYEPAPNPVSKYCPANAPGGAVVVNTLGEPDPVTVAFEMNFGGAAALPYATVPLIDGPVGVGVSVGVFAGVFVAVSVGVLVAVFVAVGVNVAVGVKVAVAVGVDVLVLVAVGVNVAVGVDVDVVVAVAVEVFVGVVDGLQM